MVGEPDARYQQAMAGDPEAVFLRVCSRSPPMETKLLVAPSHCVVVRTFLFTSDEGGSTFFASHLLFCADKPPFLPAATFLNFSALW